MGGGVGSRFWPVSRENKPKQFLDFFGTGESLLQQTFRRMSQFVPKENILIVTNEVYIEETLRQLPELLPDQILAEPIRRNTAPCIAYAAYHIRSKCPDASIFVTPSDHIILQEARFAEFATKALEYVADHDSLVTLGIMVPSRNRIWLYSDGSGEEPRPKWRLLAREGLYRKARS